MPQDVFTLGRDSETTLSVEIFDYERPSPFSTSAFQATSSTGPIFQPAPRMPTIRSAWASACVANAPRNSAAPLAPTRDATQQRQHVIVVEGDTIRRHQVRPSP